MFYQSQRKSQLQNQILIWAIPSKSLVRFILICCSQREIKTFSPSKDAADGHAGLYKNFTNADSWRGTS